MGNRLRPEDVVTIVVLQERGTPKRAIARTLGVTEGAVRYHLRRKAAGAEDRRKFKHFKAEQLEAVIRAWVVASSEVDRPERL
jgi:predicted transcriptional regulator